MCERITISLRGKQNRRYIEGSTVADVILEVGGANKAKFTVNVWEKIVILMLDNSRSLTFHSFYELQTKNAS